MTKIILVIVIVIVAVLILFRISNNTNMSNVTQNTSTTGNQTLKIEDIKKGNGPAVKKGDTIVVNYKGTLLNGKQFDSSYDRGTPFETKIGVGSVIEGWDQGIIGMKVGGTRKLIIPPSLGYGNMQAGSIPPNSTLIFTIQLLQIK